MLRIRLEHAIGFLKGHFQLLRDLHVLIQDEKTHKSAVYWVVVCISIHSFATRCKLGRQAEDHDLAEDPFVAVGQSATCNYDEPMQFTGQTQGSARLAKGKEKKEQLKAAWMAENELQDYSDYE